MTEQESRHRASANDLAGTPRPYVSVCILSYNHAPFVEQALRSVLEQVVSFSFEIVFADDFSTDGTSQLAREILRNSGVQYRVLPRQRNLGVLATFIELLSSARGEYVAFLESDDYWTTSSKLAEQVTLLDSERALTGCYGRAKVVDASDQVLGDYFDHHQLLPPSSDIDQRTALERGASGPACTYFFRRRAVERMPAWFLSVASHQALLVLLTEHGAVRFVDRSWGSYRIHPGGVWSSASIKRKISADLRFAVALASDPILAKRYPRELGARLTLTALSLARASAGEGLFSFARIGPELGALANAEALRTILFAVPEITRFVLKRIGRLLVAGRHE